MPAVAPRSVSRESRRHDRDSTARGRTSSDTAKASASSLRDAAAAAKDVNDEARSADQRVIRRSGDRASREFVLAPRGTDLDERLDDFGRDVEANQENSMLIVCTQDNRIIDFTRSAESGAARWGELVELPHGRQRQATLAFKSALGRVGDNEDLCLSAHGNDDEIGDEDGGWTWTASQVAELLADNLPNGYRGRILIRACTDTVASFAAHLAVELERRERLYGVWIYGYIKHLAIKTQYPEPKNLDKDVELSPHQVKFLATGSELSGNALAPYQVVTRAGHIVQIHPGFDAREVATLLSVLDPDSFRAAANRPLKATTLTNLVVASAVGTVVLRAPDGAYDDEKGALWVKPTGSRKENGGPQEGTTYTISFDEDGSPKSLPFKGYFAGVGYEFK
jgi:hypothetical protein